MKDIKTYRLVKALDAKLEPFVGEKFILVEQSGSIYKLGGMGKALGHVVVTTRDIFKEEFEEIDIEKEINSMIDDILGKFVGIDFSSNKETVKEEVKEESKQEETQLDRIERKLDRMLKFCNIG